MSPRRGIPETDLTALPAFALVDAVRVPTRSVSPVAAIVRRIGYALAALAAAIVVVYVDRDGYTDTADGEVSLLDCAYYATVSLSTTGYGDITPITPTARLVVTLVVTALRILFLLVLVGTTLAALTEGSRHLWRMRQWRNRIRDHTVVVGYGTKGRAAVDAMLADGIPARRVVVVDPDAAALADASGRGLVTVHGDAARSDVLRTAAVDRARRVVVAADRDEAAVLITLTVRHLAPRAVVVAAVRESASMQSLRRSGAETVVVSSEAAGRMLGLAVTTPNVVTLVEDLLTRDSGYALTQRAVQPAEIGRSPLDSPGVVLGVVRDGRLRRAGASGPDTLATGDSIIEITRADR